MGWVNIPASESLLAEYNEAFPDRDKSSDGSIGDAAHKAKSSDHNADDTAGSSTPYTDSDSVAEVHARDVDSTLRKTGWTQRRCVDIIVSRHRSGADNRLQNVICDGWIWSRSTSTPWSKEPYTATSDDHTGHAHFSFRYGSGSGTSNPENITKPWGILAAIEEEEMPSPEEYAAAVWGKPNDGVGTTTGSQLSRAVRGALLETTDTGALNDVLQMHTERFLALESVQGDILIKMSEIKDLLTAAFPPAS